ncbi:MAG: hypothetical protein ACI33S_06365 [Bacilli bacterium]
MKKSKKNNNKKYIYIIMLCIFIVLVFSITATYLNIFKESRGNALVVKNYYGIIFSNVTTNDDLSVRINGNVIDVQVDNINSLLTPKIFYVDVTNIGNQNVEVDGIYISNMSNSDIGNNVTVDTSMLKNDILKGSEQKKLKVKISYIGLSQENKSYKFSINYLFKEVSL